MKKYIIIFFILLFNFSFSQSIDKLLTSNKVLIASHRGDWINYPENSIPSIESVIMNKIDIVEIDIQKTKDGHFILMHDNTLDRTTNGKGKVSNFTLKDIKKFRLKYKNQITQYEIPSLESVLILCKGKISVNIDKAGPYFKEIIKIIDSLNCQHYVILKNVGSVEYFNNLVNKTDIFYMPIIQKQNLLEFINNTKCKMIEMSYIPDDKIIKIIQDKKIKIWYNALGHNNKNWKYYINKGANIIQTDYPIKLKKEN